MTQNNSNDSGSSSDRPNKKRVRDNHNELERVRRNHQKAQLEELRKALPFKDMDEKASMVSIFVRAREYIEMLEQRVVELQAELGQNVGINVESLPSARKSHLELPASLRTVPLPLPPGPSSPNQFPQHPQPPNIPSPIPLYGRTRELSVSPEHIQMHQGIPFYNPGFLDMAGQNPVAGGLLSTTTPSHGYVTPAASPIRKSLSPLNVGGPDSLLNAEILKNFVSDNYRRNNSIRRLSSDDETGILKSFRERRFSSLLMPFEDETVMIQKRDSISALFSGLLPDFVDSSFIDNGAVKCNKCRKGMCNMIMIDCDRCHKWYHIKCAKIDSDAIPTHWQCC